MSRYLYYFIVLTFLGITINQITNNTRAHEWYPPVCCAEEHCHPVPCEELKENSNGTWSYRETIFEPNQVNPSKDKDCHVCRIKALDGTMLPKCLFIQNGV